MRIITRLTAPMVCAVSLDLSNKNLRTLCDWNSGYGALQCNNYKGCPGSDSGYCYPNWVWSSTVAGSSTRRFSGGLNNGAFNVIDGSTTGIYTQAETVRCVLGFEIRLEQVAELPYMLFDTVSISPLEIFSECIKRVCLKPCLL